MKYQANRDYISNDVVMTPTITAKKLVEHFKPKGKGLEPCCGTGNILQFLPCADWCEIEKGKDFFDYKEKDDYIFTNPPWSKIRPFMEHAMEIADEIYMLFTINHLWTKARLKVIEEKEFELKKFVSLRHRKNFRKADFSSVWYIFHEVIKATSN